MPEVDSDEADP